MIGSWEIPPVFVVRGRVAESGSKTPHRAVFGPASTPIFRWTQSWTQTRRHGQVASLRLVPQRICAKLAGMNELARLEAIGREHHRAGRLAPAEACYRRILAVEPANVTALHLLGLLAHQSGHPHALARARAWPRR